MKRARHRLARVRYRYLRIEQLESRFLLSVARLAELNPASLLIPAESESTPALVNVAITTDPGVQQMPSVAVDPLDAKHLVVAYMDRPSGDTGYSGLTTGVSRDGGLNWERSPLPLPAGFDAGATYPIARFDGQGHVYVSFVAATFLGPQPELTTPLRVDPVAKVRERTYGFQSNNGIFLVRSDDGGSTWATPVSIDKFTYDGQQQVPFDMMPDVAVDTYRTLPDGRANPNFGNLYATWSQFYAAGTYPGEPDATGGSQVLFAVSRDSGQTWQTQLQKDPDTGGQVSVLRDTLGSGNGIPAGLGATRSSRIAIGPEGDIYVSTFDLGNFWVYHSTDAGKSFPKPDEATGAGVPFGASFSALAGNPSQFPNANFRIQYPRSIAADPSRPGYIYLTEAIANYTPSGDTFDEADIWFARSTDYGQTWNKIYGTGLLGDGSTVNQLVNDDNGGVGAEGRRKDVVVGQALPQIAVAPDGTIVLIWYDGRRDAAGHSIDVFASVSKDAGETFSPNFRVSDNTFDPDMGKFTDATGRDNYFLGDLIGLAATNDGAVAAWTDTRSGNQDVFLSRFSLSALPAALNDRFEPNDSPTAALELGDIVRKYIPQLSVLAGDEDWFRLKSVADGTLTLTATVALADQHLKVELYDGDGTSRVAIANPVRDPEGRVTSYRFEVPAVNGRQLLVRVTSESLAPISYDLDLLAITSDLGKVVYGNQDGKITLGSQSYYLLSAAAPGSLRVAVRSGQTFAGSLSAEILDAESLASLGVGAVDVELGAAGTALVQIEVRASQQFLVHIFGDQQTQGPFDVEFTNLDQLSTADSRTLYFPAGFGSSVTSVADFNQDGRPDVVVSDALSDTVSVLLTNSDGTLQAPREFAIGAFAAPAGLNLQTYRRDVVATDVNQDGLPDIVVLNNNSGDVSVLLGRGDGTFQPQRRFDAGPLPFALAVGDVNQDQIPDLVIVGSRGFDVTYLVLQGRGDGTFRPGASDSFPTAAALDVQTTRLVDLDGDGALDLVISPNVIADHETLIFRGRGDGTFQLHATVASFGPGLDLADLNGDHLVDIVKVEKSTNRLAFAFGNGDGTFAEPTLLDIGNAPLAVITADVGSMLPDGELGPPDGFLDLIVADAGGAQGVLSGEAQVQVLFAQFDADGVFEAFSDPVQIYRGLEPQDVNVVDLDEDGRLDILVIDRDGLHVIYNQRPPIVANDTRNTARNLGTTLHWVQPTLTITPGNEDAWYRLQVPTEVVTRAGSQVLDFSAGFASQSGSGLRMEVTDAAGKVLEAGARLRVVASQGQVLFVHIFAGHETGKTKGYGAYTLAFDTLPQVTAVEAQTLLPGQGAFSGGPTTSLVLVFQGDRLDAATAENPANYRVTWLGRDGVFGTSDDQTIPVGNGLNSSQAVVYDPGSNVDVSSGRTYPSAVRQTVTLLFGRPLPAGSYQIEVSRNVQSAPFNADETQLLSPRDGFDGHTVVSIVDGVVQQGAKVQANGLVKPRGALGDLSVFETGTRFLTQFHNDLGALLDAQLTELGDDPAITQQILDQISARFSPALGEIGQRLVSLLVVFLDPVSIGLVDPQGQSFHYNLQTNAVASTLPHTFVEVGGNVEVVVIANPQGEYRLNVAEVASHSRGGVLYFGNNAPGVNLLTDAMRAGQRSFTLMLPASEAVRTVVIPLSSTPVNSNARLNQAAPVTSSAAVTNQSLSSSLVSFNPRTKTGIDSADPSKRMAKQRDIPFEAIEWRELLREFWNQFKLWNSLRQPKRPLEAERDAAVDDVFQPYQLPSLLQAIDRTLRKIQELASQQSNMPQPDNARPGLSATTRVEKVVAEDSAKDKPAEGAEGQVKPKNEPVPRSLPRGSAAPSDASTNSTSLPFGVPAARREQGKQKTTSDTPNANTASKGMQTER